MSDYLPSSTLTFFLIWYTVQTMNAGRLTLSEVIAGEKGKSGGHSPGDNLNLNDSHLFLAIYCFFWITVTFIKI